jgi:ABC-2 type transport system ATP-binding protein
MSACTATIGHLLSSHTFYDYLTAAEVLDYFGRFHGFSAAERGERVQKMLKTVGLRLPGKFSCENIPRECCSVSAWRSDLARSKISHLDEPMSGLDPVGRRKYATLFWN